MAVMDPKYLDLFFGQDAAGTGITEMTEEYFRQGFRFLGDEQPTDGDVTWLIQQCMLRTSLSKIGYWRPNEAVQIGYVRYPNNVSAFNIFMECIVAGTTGTTEPTWPEAGEEITESGEGTPTWKIHSSVAPNGGGRHIGDQFISFDIGDPDGCILLSAVELQRSMFPEFWEHITTKGDLRSETEYQAALVANNGYVGFYSSGDGTNTFRTPTQRPYVSGLRDGFSLNDYTADAMQRITGRIAIEMPNTDTVGMEGSIYLDSDNLPSITANASTVTTLRHMQLDSSRETRTADETRPKTIFGRWYVKAFDTVTNSGEVDISKLINDVIRNTERIEALEAASQSIWLYPGGGDALNPGNVSVNTSYELILPADFQGHAVKCFGQLFNAGEWGTMDWTSHSTNGTASFGLSVRQLGNKVILNTGLNGLINSRNYDGNPWNNNTLLTSLPCRIYVEKGGLLP